MLYTNLHCGQSLSYFKNKQKQYSVHLKNVKKFVNKHGTGNITLQNSETCIIICFLRTILISTTYKK